MAICQISLCVFLMVAHGSRHGSDFGKAFFHSGALGEERGNLESCVFFLFYEGWIIFNGQFIGLILICLVIK